MTATQAAAAVVAEGGDTDEVRVLITDPGEEVERNSRFVSLAFAVWSVVYISTLNCYCRYIYIFFPLFFRSYRSYSRSSSRHGSRSSRYS